MRKVILLVSISILVLLISFCSNYKILQRNNAVMEQDIELDANAQSIMNNNPYFFKDTNIKKFDEVYIKYTMKYNLFEGGQQNILLSVQHLTELDNGNIYKLEFIKPTDNYIVNTYLEDYRFKIGIFYVNDYKIYRLMGFSEENLDNLKYEYELLDNIDDNIIVCQEEVIMDDPDRKGYHNYLDIDGDIRIFRSYNNQVETGYYERIIWAKDIGLAAYLSGFGAENMQIIITLDEEYEKYTSSVISW